MLNIAILFPHYIQENIFQLYILLYNYIVYIARLYVYLTGVVFFFIVYL